MDNIITFGGSMTKQINFAMQQNYVPVFRNITMTNNTDEELSNVRLRIRFEPEFAAVFEEVKAAVDGMMRDGFFHPSWFEFLFAMGMLYFSRQEIDLLLCETGLGGRLDATNVNREPVLTVITSISLDHMEYLGNTVAEIAGEKAGILKPGVPVVYDASCPEAAAFSPVAPFVSAVPSAKN